VPPLTCLWGTGSTSFKVSLMRSDWRTLRQSACRIQAPSTWQAAWHVAIGVHYFSLLASHINLLHSCPPPRPPTGNQGVWMGILISCGAFARGVGQVAAFTILVRTLRIRALFTVRIYLKPFHHTSRVAVSGYWLGLWEVATIVHPLRALSESPNRVGGLIKFRWFERSCPPPQAIYQHGALRQVRRRFVTYLSPIRPDIPSLHVCRFQASLAWLVQLRRFLRKTIKKM
jgi:hypothetical protein